MAIEDEASDPKALEITFGPTTAAQIRAIADGFDPPIKPGEAVRRALSLYGYIRKQLAEGHTVYIGKDGEHHMEVLIP